MQSPASGECLETVCEKGITVGRRGAWGWMKMFGLMGM